VPHQVALTIRAAVHPREVDRLKAVLADLASDGRRAKLLPFEDLPVHFARFVILDEVTDLHGNRIEPSLYFMSDIDSPPRRFVRELVDVAADGLDQIFSHCEGYPDSPTAQQRVAYLEDRSIKPTAAYVNTVGRSVKDVRGEAQLRDAIEAFLDRRNWSDRTAVEVRAAVVDYVAGEPTLAWALRKAQPPSLSWRAKQLAHLVGAVVVLLVLAPILLAVLPFWLVALRIHERRDVPSQRVPDPVHVEALADVEDVIVQNQFTAVGFVKPGWFRRTTLSGVLWMLGLSARHVFNAGSLAGIHTIHFARWVFLDGKRRLIFISNYDGSLESYMDDFIDKVAWGLNAAFSNGVGYPRTRWLMLDGAKDERAFKNYLRDNQLPTPIWYSAYGDLTAVNIANNASIRRGLRGKASAAQAEQWARLL